jgi:hypothetical protein
MVIFLWYQHGVYGIVIFIDPKSAQAETGAFTHKPAHPTHHTNLSQNKDKTDITAIFYCPHFNFSEESGASIFKSSTLSKWH